MVHEINLKQIERKAYMAFHEDGLWDLAIGLVLLGLAATVMGNFKELMGIAAISPAFAVVIVPLLRKTLTLPRLGYVEFSPERKVKQMTNYTALAVVGLLIGLLGVVVSFGYAGYSDWQLFIRDLGLVPIGSVMALASVAIGLAFGIRRCYLYTVVILLSFLVIKMIDVHPFVAFIFPGVAMTAGGIFLLNRFLHKYPKPHHEAGNEH